MTEKESFTYSHPRPGLTVDTAVFTVAEGELCVLLIQRAHEPFAGRWALPGGFVNEMEPLESAARRELEEETGVRVGSLWPIGTFGDPGRDPRGWTVSAAYYAVLPTADATIQAADDAQDAAWHSVLWPPPLAFDHQQVLETACARLTIDAYHLPVLAPLLPAEFSWEELGAVYQLIDTALPSEEALRRRAQANGLVGATEDGKRLTWKSPAHPCQKRYDN